jgi:transcriptional regulator with XRE-family HTH domain
MKLSTDTSRLRHLLLVALGQEHIGRLIKEARESADLTQQELADRIGIKQGQTISNYERGVTEVSTKRLRRIATETGKPITFFVQEPAAEPDEEDGSAAVLAELHSRLEGIAATVARVAEGQAEILSALADLQADAQAAPAQPRARPRRKKAAS